LESRNHIFAWLAVCTLLGLNNITGKDGMHRLPLQVAGLAGGCLLSGRPPQLRRAMITA